MRRLLASEGGSALIAAMAVLFIVLMVGFATLSWADNGFRTSREERERESSFNLVEAVLKEQVRELSRNWPSSSSTTYHCPDATQPSRCPAETVLAQSYTGTDYADGYTWSTDVQDNGGPVGGSVQSRYSTTLAGSQPGYDANGDGRLWVRAQATVRGKTRRLVTQVQARQVPLPFPQNAVTAQFLSTTNQGNKTIIDAQGSGRAGEIAVRCSPPTTPCLDYKDGQVSPAIPLTGYSSGDALTPEERDALKATAKRYNTYYASGCPSASQLTGAVVYVESGPCSYNGGSANTAGSPGMIYINSSTLTFSGNFEYYGLIYAHNASGIAGTVVSLQGTSLIHGAVAVDGQGGVSTGSSGLNLIYDPNVFNVVLGYGSAEPLPGLFRELRPDE